MQTLSLSRKPNSLPVFLLVWLGQFVSLLGSGLTEFALGVWVYQQTGSVTRFALTFVFLTLPRILLSPFAGSIIDRQDRRWIMLLSDLGAGITTLLLAALFWMDAVAIWHIYVLTTVGSLSSTFQRPAYAASIPLMVTPDHFGRANGMVQVAQASASLIAPVLAGYLLIAAGIETILLLDLATFLFAVITLLVVRFPFSQALSPSEAHAPSIWQDTVAGLLYVWQRPGLRGLLITFSAASFLGLSAEILLTPYVLAAASPTILGLVAAASGAGLLAGGVAMSWWASPRHLIVGILGFEALVSLCMILLGISAAPWFLGTVVFVYFAVIALGDGYSQTFWQRKVAVEFQGRVFALRQMITLATVPAGVLILAPLAEYVFEPSLLPGGAWASTIGLATGVGPGRGIGLLFMLAGIVNLCIIGGAFAAPSIRTAEQQIPDGGS